MIESRGTASFDSLHRVSICGIFALASPSGELQQPSNHNPTGVFTNSRVLEYHHSSLCLVRAQHDAVELAMIMHHWLRSLWTLESNRRHSETGPSSRTPSMGSDHFRE
jgi:hypothetical protein